MIDFDRFAVAPAFLTFGESATYTPPAGSPMPCRVIREGGGKPVKFGPITVYLSSLTFDVRASDVPDPATGGVFTVGAMSYTVTGTPFHPEDDPHGHVWSCDVLWGAPVLYRTSTGNGTTLNPPNGSGWAVSGNAVAGAVTLTVKGLLPSGRLLTGDTITVGAVTYTVATPVSANTTGFPNVALTTPLLAPLADGTAVTLGFTCDRPVLAALAGYDASQLLGGIVVSDRRVIIMQERLTAAGIPTPTSADSVLITGRWFRVRNAAAIYTGSTPAVWDLEIGG